MTRRNARVLVAAVLVVVSPVAAACSDGDDEGDGRGTVTTAVDGGPGSDDGVLIFGTLLPETGDLAFLGAPMLAGVDLAIREIQEAGVLGEGSTTVVRGDSGDSTTDIGSQTVSRLLGENIDVVIGTASSAVTLTVIDTLVEAGVVQISPANAAKLLATYDDDGLYFRTAPSDILQGQVLGELVLDDGSRSVGILARDDPYGKGMAEDLAAAITGAGGEVLATKIYDPNAETFDVEVQTMVDVDPDAIVVVGFDESARIITRMIEQGIGPQDKRVYGADGNMGETLGAQFADAPGALAGIKGTTPLTQLREEFKRRLLAIDPTLGTALNYAAESYDAVLIAALASLAAGSTNGNAIAAELAAVTRDGTRCIVFQRCVELLADGEDIDYDGASGPIDLDDNGDPAQASFGILQFNAENKVDILEYRLAGATPTEG